MRTESRKLTAIAAGTNSTDEKTTYAGASSLQSEIKMSTGRSVMRSLKLTTGVGALAVCAAAAGAELQSCPPAGARTIVVTGTAAVRVPPDRVSFSVGVETEAPSVAKAVEANSAKVAALLAA